MVETKLTYEECRRQRLEENKKKLEELNLTKLAQDLKASSPKTTPVKKGKSRSRFPGEPSSVPLRRSSRVSDKPPPNYKEVPVEPLGAPRRSYSRRYLLNRVYASDKSRQYAIHRAEKVQSELDSDGPSFIKPMFQSHVTGGFWLGLPSEFCKRHLPLKDKTITLVDEDEDEFPTKYLADKNGLSGGWRGFSIDHKLVDGDALVFHLVQPTVFQVYIIRAHESEDDEVEETKENKKDSGVRRSGRSAKRIKTSEI